MFLNEWTRLRIERFGVRATAERRVLILPGALSRLGPGTTSCSSLMRCSAVWGARARGGRATRPTPPPTSSCSPRASPLATRSPVTALATCPPPQHRHPRHRHRSRVFSIRALALAWSKLGPRCLELQRPVLHARAAAARRRGLFPAVVLSQGFARCVDNDMVCLILQASRPRLRSRRTV